MAGPGAPLVQQRLAQGHSGTKVAWPKVSFGPIYPGPRQTWGKYDWPKASFGPSKADPRPLWHQGSLGTVLSAPYGLLRLIGLMTYLASRVLASLPAAYLPTAFLLPVCLPACALPACPKRAAAYTVQTHTAGNAGKATVTEA